jgi:hypothetical protein
MFILVLELIGSIGIILLSCELFANSVEHVGNKFGMSHAAAALCSLLWEPPCRRL